MNSGALTANKWGFSIEKDNPFAIFILLQKIAAKHAGPQNVIDLSRGDPGYGFTPGARGRRFYSYLLMLDTYLNNAESRFSNFEAKDFEDLMAGIAGFTGTQYGAETAGALLEDLEFFTDRVIEAAAKLGIEWSRFEVLDRVFRNCAVSGGSYLDPRGEEITRTVLAGWYSDFIETPFTQNDLILFNGASHVIGSLFKALGDCGIGYLASGSSAAICTPAYAPYLRCIENLGMNALSLPVSPVDGSIPAQSLDSLENTRDRLKMIIIIDPNNPTGFSLKEETLARIADIAKKHDCPIISDEVYTSFFPKKKTMIDFAPERTLRIDARSKIERSTGLRFGDLLLTKTANGYLTGHVLKKWLGPGLDLRGLLIKAKGPGGSGGEFGHTTFVPGPSQFLGISHVIFGEAERRDYFNEVKQNSKIFMDILGLKDRGNLYYSIFDLNEIRGCNKINLPAEEKLFELAKMGVVYLPVYQFFPDYERSSRSSLSMVRASIVNTSAERVKAAAEITKKYLTS